LGIPTVRPGGKLGNVVFIRAADGYIVRERVPPANPRTAPQLRALPDAAFEAWNASGKWTSVGATIPTLR
jgi:hypothetical protein